MSDRSIFGWESRRDRDALRERLEALPAVLRISPARLGALLAAAGLIVAFASVLYDIADVTGRTALFTPVVALAAVAATVLARVVSDRIGLAIAGVGFGLGSLWYLAALSYFPGPVGILASNLELLSGLSLLRLDAVGRWVLITTPVLTFLTWFFVLRGRYAAGLGVGAGTLGYLVLTGDAGTTTTLLGVVAAVALVGFGDLDQATAAAAGSVSESGNAPTGSIREFERLVVVLAIMILAPLAVTVVPGGAATPLSLVGSDAPTMEDAVVAQDELDIVGSVDQSPQVRFTVTGDEPRRWRTASFDRYTGDGWVRTGDTSPGVGVEASVGETRSASYEVVVESPLQAVPVPWKPTAVEGLSTTLRQTETGGLRADETLSTGDSYTVTGAIPNATDAALAGAGTDYPDAIAEKYTQLPDSTPDRVADRTAEIAASADDPYATAVLIERWLETNREYSLDVDRPTGNIADAFLFEMEAGYCTYYATTMVTMLRSQDIPARLAVGYSPGEQTGDDKWVVRGLDSHAWVEVYVPNQGWVEFDPTPASSRESTEQTRIDSAIAAGEEGVQPESVDSEPDSTGTDEEQTTQPENPQEAGPDPIEESSTEGTGAPGEIPIEVADPGSGGTAPDTGSGDGAGPLAVVTDRPREQLALGAVVATGLFAGVRRTEAHTRLAWGVRLRLPRRSEDPTIAVERAHDRLGYLLARRYRERRPDETMRAYADAVGAGADAHRLIEIRERARYGGGVSEGDADEAHKLLRRVRG